MAFVVFPLITILGSTKSDTQQDVTFTTTMSNFNTTSSDLGEEGGIPTLLLASFCVIGALILIILVLIAMSVFCCIIRRRKSKNIIFNNDSREKYIRTTSQILEHGEQPRPSYFHQPVQQQESIRKYVENENTNSSCHASPCHFFDQSNSLKHSKQGGTLNSEISQDKYLSPQSPIDNHQDTQENMLYDSIIHRERCPLPSQVSPILESVRPKLQVQPQEIISYNSEIPKTFIPYAPPPPVSGLSSTDKLHKINASQNMYNITVESLADYDEVESFDNSPMHFLRKPHRTLSLQSYRSYCHSPSDSESYYDTVETFHRASPGLTSSFQLSTDHSGMYNKSHYQSPRRQHSQTNHKSNFDADRTYMESLEPSMFQHRSSLSSIESDTLLPFAPIYDTPKHFKHNDRPLEISPHNISEIQYLGNGRFGPVILAATVDLSLKDLCLGESTQKDRSFLVAVKKLKRNAELGLKNAFKEEMVFISRLKHANVVRLLGMCSSTTSPFIIIEYMENGDLHEFLQKQALVADDTKNLEEGEATPLILLYMAVQVASGMRYLASRKFIHRDLAARNCLVGREFVVKISDFGMSRDLYKAYYYRVQGQLTLPIRWMPCESFFGKFSTKSDVWSFGVTMWEIYSMAENEPYDKMTNEDVISDATKGQKRTILKRPDICPREVYDIMLRCWVHEPSVRADFEEVYSRLFLIYMTESQKASN